MIEARIIFVFIPIKIPHSPKFSIFIPFTRYWVLERFLKSLEDMQLDKENSELIFYNDTQDEDLQKALLLWLERFGPKFNGACLYQSGKVPPSEFDVAYRRERICAMKEGSKDLLSDTQYVFCLEDDTIAPANSFVRLLEHIISDNRLAIVSGVEVGRWAIPMIGAWDIDSLDDPHRLSSVPYRDSGTQKVDACGWYCYITPTPLYKAAHYRQASESFGPCETYTWDLRREGYEALIDWELPCEHMMENGKSILPYREVSDMIWEKQGNDWGVVDTPIVVKLKSI